MSGETSINMKGVNLTYPPIKQGGFSILDFIARRKRVKNVELAALKDISLTIKRGEIVGILGHNGAGKSTLLRVMAGIYQPDSGEMEINGTTTLLASLGTGFQRDLTGRENIILSSIFHGLDSDKTKALVPSIILFAGLEDAIDKPLRTYSSGMRARLGFSIIAHLNPEILLIDEVFAVGDASFRERSRKRIKEMVESDATVIIVTHNETIIQNMCDRAICIDEGEVILDTRDIAEAIETYHNRSMSRDNS